jgi:hypothetical protein
MSSGGIRIMAASVLQRESQLLKGNHDSEDGNNSCPSEEGEDLIERESSIRNRGRPPTAAHTEVDCRPTSVQEILATLQKELADLKAFKAASIAKEVGLSEGPHLLRSNRWHQKKVKQYVSAEIFYGIRYDILFTL